MEGGRTLAWFKVDDGFSSSPKVLSIRRRDRLAAVGLWTVAGAWAAKHLTDGFIPAYMLEELAAEESQVDNLVTAGLWREEGDGYQFHDWHDYQPTRVDVLANRERERARKEAYRAKKSGNTGQSPAGTGSDRDAGQERVSGHPDPTRPDPTSISNEIDERGPRKRGTRIPEPFMLTTEMREWAAAEVPTADAEASTRRFVDYWRAESGAKATKLDWIATWRNWLRRDADSKKPNRLTPTERAAQTAAAGRRVAGQQITSLSPKEVTS